MKAEFKGYKPGDRVRMIYCADSFAPIETGAEGVIEHIDDIGTLHVRWDNGRTLGVCLEEDSITKL